MKKISILILEQSLPSGIVSLVDVFKMAGAVWDKSYGFAVNPLFVSMIWHLLWVWACEILNAD